MSLHTQFGAAVMVGSLVVVVAAIRSALRGLRSGGRADHRLALDRAVLVVLGVLILAGLLGALLLATGSRPSDPLHLVYGPAGVVALPLAIWMGTRNASGDANATRVRRDLWTAGGGIVLLGIGLRLFATG